MVLFSHSSYLVGAEQTNKKRKKMKLAKDLYEKDGEYVLSDGHPKKWAGQGCHFIAKKGTEISDLEAKEYGIAKETKAKEPKENKAK